MQASAQRRKSQPEPCQRKAARARGSARPVPLPLAALRETRIACSRQVRRYPFEALEGWGSSTAITWVFAHLSPSRRPAASVSTSRSSMMPRMLPTMGARAHPRMGMTARSDPFFLHSCKIPGMHDSLVSHCWPFISGGTPRLASRHAASCECVQSVQNGHIMEGRTVWVPGGTQPCVEN